jgi:hypothetical protein
MHFPVLITQHVDVFVYFIFNDCLRLGPVDCIVTSVLTGLTLAVSPYLISGVSSELRHPPNHHSILAGLVLSSST